MLSSPILCFHHEALRRIILNPTLKVSVFAFVYCLIAFLPSVRADIANVSHVGKAVKTTSIYAHSLSANPQVTSTSEAITAAAAPVEPAATTRFLTALEHRRSIDPTRFDHYHPVIGRMIGEQEVLNSGAVCSPTMAMQFLLPSTNYYNAMRARRDLDPARFDHYHKNLGALLAEDERLRTLIAECLAQQVLTPPAGGTGTGGTPGGTGTGGGTTQAVPEPSPLALFFACALLIAGSNLQIRKRLRPVS